MFEEKAVKFIEKLENLTTQYAPEIIDNVLTMVQLDGVTAIILGLLGIFSFILSIIISIMIYKKKKEENNWGNFFAQEIVILIIIGFNCIFSILCIFGFVTILNVWNWVAIWNPKLALVHTILL